MRPQWLAYQNFGQPTWCLRIFALLAGAPLVRATRRPIRKQTRRARRARRSIFLLRLSLFPNNKQISSSHDTSRPTVQIEAFLTYQAEDKRNPRRSPLPSLTLDYSGVPASAKGSTTNRICTCAQELTPKLHPAPKHSLSTTTTTTTTTNRHSALFQCELTLLLHQHSAYPSAELRLSRASTTFHRFTPYGGAWSSVFPTQQSLLHSPRLNTCPAWTSTRFLLALSRLVRVSSSPASACVQQWRWKQPADLTQQMPRFARPLSSNSHRPPRPIS